MEAQAHRRAEPGASFGDFLRGTNLRRSGLMERETRFEGPAHPCLAAWACSAASPDELPLMLSGLETSPGHCHSGVAKLRREASLGLGGAAARAGPTTAALTVNGATRATRTSTWVIQPIRPRQLVLLASVAEVHMMSMRKATIRTLWRGRRGERKRLLLNRLSRRSSITIP